MNSQRLLQPGLALMSRLRLRSKLILLVTMLGAPVLFQTGANLMALHDDWAATVRGHDGLAVAQAAVATTAELRALATAAMPAAGNAEVGAAALLPARAALRESIVALADAIAIHPRLGLADEWARQRPPLEAVATATEGGTSQMATQLPAAEQAARSLLARVAERSGLDLEAEPVNYYRIELSMRALERTADIVSRLGARADADANRGDAAVALASRTQALLSLFDLRRAELAEPVAALQRHGGTLTGAWLNQQRALDALHHRLKITAEGAEGATHAALAADAKRAVEALQTQQRGMLAELRLAFEQRRTTLAWRMAWHAAVSLVAALLLAYLAVALYRSVGDALHGLQRGVLAVESGDLTERIDVAGGDEVARIAASVEQNHQRLSQIVSHIRSSAVRVGGAGDELATASRSLASRTEEQAASVQQAAQVFERLRQEIERNSQAASEVDGITTRLCTQVEAGSAAMHESVQRMGRLETSAARMAEIITTIDDIAFQTNVLALNAAVEAAKAGEAGRSFAVVALEVRQLAQRCGTAAGEIRALIRESVDEVGASVSHIHGVGATLDELVQGVREVSVRLNTIAESSVSQAQGLAEVAQGVSQIEAITRQNQDMVERSTRAAQTLAERASSLTDAVAFMRLRQGSADEALALTLAARNLVAAQGLERARAQFYERGGRFLDRDLYVFVLDREGIYIVHGAKPEVEGRHAQVLVGVHGERFRDEVWAAADAGGGWAEYQMLDATTGQVHPKESYVMPLDEQRLIGCGVYMTVPTRRATTSAAAPSHAAPGAQRIGAALAAA